MKFAIDLGHGVSYDTGAVGVKKEEDCINPVGALVIQKLQSLGHSVVAVRPSSTTSLVDSLRQRTAKANVEHADVYVSIHFNCGGGRGTEVFAVSDAGRKIAQPVLNELVKLGYINRGLKEAHFFVLVHTDMPAILIEGSFVDSAEDMAMYNAEDYANAIVKGLTGQTAKPAVPYPGYCLVQKTAYDGIVKLMQKKLIELGFLAAGEADGYFGPRTRNAVLSFQNTKKLDVDGVVGPITWKALFN